MKPQQLQNSKSTLVDQSEIFAEIKEEGNEARINKVNLQINFRFLQF